MPDGGTGMFKNLTTANITTEATSWTLNFNDVVLVIVGMGVAFAAIRFVKSLFA